jgi:YegS/Rv2252/BmrU family lipid kinase
MKENTFAPNLTNKAYLCNGNRRFMTEKKKITLIVNPKSGTTGKKKILETVEEELDKDKFTYNIVRTQYAGHASVLTKQAVEEGVDVVVAIGGDGTVNEIARALTHTGTALGIIPCGSGNGLARHLHIPMDIRKATRVINHCLIHTLDYGMINEFPFFCTCGVGFDAFISMRFSHSGKRGILTYLENTLTEFLKYEPVTYEITADEGTQQHKALLIACANASQYGNNAFIAPHASMKDGLMDVVIMEPFTMMEAPQMAIQLFNRKLDQNSHIKSFRCKKLHIKRAEAGLIHYDGDPVTTGKDIEVILKEKGINIVVNANAKKEYPVLPQTIADFLAGWNNATTLFKEGNDKIKSLNQELLRKLINRE